MLTRLRRRASGPSGTGRPPHHALTALSGAGIGFTTMVANAGGPLMTLYLLAARVDKLRFLGVTSWFFLILNLSKLPFSASLGLLGESTVVPVAVLWPLVLVGCWAGTRLVRRMTQRQFDVAVLATSVLAAVPLLL